MVIAVGGSKATDFSGHDIPQYKDLDLPNGTPPSHYRYTGVCHKCIFHKSKTFQYPHGDGKNWDLSCVTVCTKYDFVVDNSNCNRVCDDFVMESWELRGRMNREERIKVLLELRKDGIEVVGPNRNISNSEFYDLQRENKDLKYEDIPDILEGL